MCLGGYRLAPNYLTSVPCCIASLRAALESSLITVPAILRTHYHKHDSR